MNSRLVTRHLQELISSEIVPVKTEESVNDDLLTRDITDAEDKTEIRSTVVPSEIAERMKERFKKAKQEHQGHEERLRISKTQIELVNKEAKDLAAHVDSFIRKLRGAAHETGDNKRLLSRLEQLRRTSVSFIRAIEAQLPGYATALFVESTEEPSDAK
jgi:PleD family two-component response regulator